MQLAQNTPIHIGDFEPPTDAFNPNVTGNQAADLASSQQQLETILSNVIGTITAIVGLAFLLFLLFGAVQWITAGGDEGKIENAKKQITNAGLGLIATIVAWSIMTVVSQVLGVPFLDMSKALQLLQPS